MKKEKIYRVFSHLPELATERLTLRKMLVADASDMYEYASRPDVTKYLSWNPHPDRDFTREYLEYLGNRYSAGMFYDWAVVYEPDCKMIGTCGFTAFTVTMTVPRSATFSTPNIGGAASPLKHLKRSSNLALKIWDCTASRRALWKATIPRVA